MVGLSREGLPITPSKLAATVGAGRGGGEGPREQWGLSLLSGLCRGLKPRHPQCRVGLLGGHISCFRTTLDESCGCGGPSGPACPSSGQGHSPDLGAASQDSLSPSARRPPPPPPPPPTPPPPPPGGATGSRGGRSVGRGAACARGSGGARGGRPRASASPPSRAPPRGLPRPLPRALRDATSDQTWRPAEFKHISQRRKRN